MRRPYFKTLFFSLFGLLVGISFLFLRAQPAYAAASMYLGSAASVQVGDVISVTVNVNTGGDAANSYDGNFSFPANLFEPVQGSTSGSVCSIWINTPDPSQNPGEIQCGSSTPLNGTGLIGTYKLKAVAAGSGSFGLSGCQVLASDGKGTDITGGCSGAGISVHPVATPAPTAAPTAAPATASTTQARTTPKPVVNVQQTPKPAEQPKTPTPTPTPPPPPSAQPLPTPDNKVAPAAAASTPTPPTSSSSAAKPDTSASQKRSIAKAFQDLLQSVKDFQKSPHDVPGLVAILLSLIPVLALSLAIVFFIYRLFLLERRRKRMLDRLFEMELSELAALEGKLDVLSEKGNKGREEYREEFKQAKEHILRQLRPDYGRPVDPEKKDQKPSIVPDTASSSS